MVFQSLSSMNGGQRMPHPLYSLCSALCLLFIYIKLLLYIIFVFLTLSLGNNLQLQNLKTLLLFFFINDMVVNLVRDY